MRLSPSATSHRCLACRATAWHRLWGEGRLCRLRAGRHQRQPATPLRIPRADPQRRPAGSAAKEPQTVGIDRAAFDPCAAIQRSLTRAAGRGRGDIPSRSGQRREGGTGADRAVYRHRYRRGAGRKLHQVSHILGALRRDSRSLLHLMINQRLLDQTLACRVLATAFYQVGGAFGFRCQLQDVMALVAPMRDAARDLLGVPSVRGGRGSPTVARPVRQGGPDPDLGRRPLAPLRRRPSGGDGRESARRGRALHAWDQSGAGPGRLLHPHSVWPGRDGIRRLPAGARPGPLAMGSRGLPLI